MKVIYKLFPLILIFVFCFSFTVLAEDNSVYMDFYQEYSEPLFGETECINYFFENFESITGVSYEEYKYVVIRCEERKYHNVQSVSIYYSNSFINAKPYSDTHYQLYDFYGNSPRRCIVTRDNGVLSYSFPSFDYPYIAYNASYDLPLYSSQDVFLVSGETGLWLRGLDESILDSGSSSDNDFFFGAFEDFADFGEESAEHYNNAMNQTVTENSNNPNDSVFQNILQAMVGSLTTNNSITQQISNQLQHFSEQFFNNFVQYSLGLMNDILNTLNEFTGKFDSLLEITGQLYESGLDSEGNFDVGTMLSYWFLPDPDGIMTSLQDIVYSDTQLSPIISYADTFKEQLISIKPEAPEIIIPAGTYGSIVLEKDVVITFDWFEDWKQYSDPIIATFLYIAYFWHLFCQIPTIFHGGAATVASGNHYQEHVIREQNKQALKSHRG